MALISISGLSKNVITGNTSETVIVFDGSLSVSPSISNTVTKRPIEEGYDVTDAIHNNPTMLNIEIIITDTAQSIIDERSVSNLPNSFGATFVKTFVQRQLDALETISNNKETVSFESKYKSYNGYFVENVSYTETSDSALQISFSLSENRTDIVKIATSNISPSIGIFS